MKRATTISILLSLLCIFLVSCSDVVFKHDGQKVTVMVVGLDYSPKGESNDSLRWGGYNVPKLKATINDSKEISAALDSLYNERGIEHEMIIMLSEGKTPDFDSSLYPSNTKVIERIRSLDLDEDDLFVFYFAGHGFLKESELHLISGEYYSGGQCSSIGSKSLMNEIKTLKCRTAVIIDACYSGAFDPKNSTTPESFTSSLDNIFKENIVIKESNMITVLASAKWNEQSWEGYNILFSDDKSEQHGQFSARLLAVLDWNHSSTVQTEVENCDGSIFVANGFSGNLRGSLSMDDIYTKIFDLRTYPTINQTPVLYYNNESIVLIPSN